LINNKILKSGEDLNKFGFFDGNHFCQEHFKKLIAEEKARIASLQNSPKKSATAASPKHTPGSPSSKKDNLKTPTPTMSPLASPAKSPKKI
jgi:hypothetical protein